MVGSVLLLETPLPWHVTRQIKHFPCTNWSKPITMSCHCHDLMKKIIVTILSTFLKLPFFGEECIPMNMQLYIISTILMVTTYQKPHDPDSRPQEKSTKKCCVSFETECIAHCSTTDFPVQRGKIFL